MAVLERLFAPVFPPDVFVLRDAGASYFHFDSPRKGEWRLAAARESDFPPDAWHDQTLGKTPAGPRVLADMIEGARRLAGGRLSRASVVIPDSWIRVFLVDFEEATGSAKEIEEMISWKLKKLLPFRPEEFRFVWSPVQMSGQKKCFVVGVLDRVALGIESSFAELGIRVGSIEAESFAVSRLPSPASPSSPVDEFVLLAAGGHGFQILIVRSGEPLLYRSKKFLGEEGKEHDGLVKRELDLTRAFLASGKGLPGRCRVWRDPAAPPIDLAALAGEVVGGEIEEIRLPPAIEVPREFPPQLVARAAVAAGTFFGRSRP